MTIAYGICVRTCSICGQPVAVDDNIVVSEIGEQWSPQIAPSSTAAKHAKTIRLSPDIVAESGAAIGSTRAIVAHDEPVENATSPDRIKIINGRTVGENESPTRATKVMPVPKSSQTFLMAHAKMSIAAASDNVFMPLK